jgi:hypothetical protein
VAGFELHQEADRHTRAFGEIADRPPPGGAQLPDASAEGRQKRDSHPSSHVRDEGGLSRFMVQYIALIGIAKAV